MAKHIYKPSNSKYYYFRASIDGKEYRQSLQTSSQRAAQALANKRIKELRSEAEANPGGWLFHNGFVSFHDDLSNEKSQHGWSASTKQRYRSSLLQIGATLAEIFAERGVDIEEIAAWEITPAEVAEYVALRKESGASIATINRDLTAFSHLFSYMKNKGWVETNPVRVFEKRGMRETLPDIVLPTDEAIRKLADRAPGTLALFPQMLNETGCRVNEMAMVKWSDIQGFDKPIEGNVKLTLRQTKGGKVRTITLRQAAIDVLSQVPRSNSSHFIFWNKTECGYYRSAANLFWEYGQETRFGARLHDIRHKFAVERLREGWSVYRVQKYIGHGSVVTTERYYFRYLSQEEQAVARSDGNAGL